MRFSLQALAVLLLDLHRKESQSLYHCQEEAEESRSTQRSSLDLFISSFGPDRSIA